MIAPPEFFLALAILIRVKSVAHFEIDHLLALIPDRKLETYPARCFPWLTRLSWSMMGELGQTYARKIEAQEQ